MITWIILYIIAGIISARFMADDFDSSSVLILVSIFWPLPIAFYLLLWFIDLLGFRIR
jgi:hypothetical protein